MNESRQPRVLVLSLGGTISSTNENSPNAGVVPRLTAIDLIAGVPQLREVADVEANAFRQMPSGDLTLTDLAELAEVIKSSFDEGFDGVVVTQGTDTMEETSFVLDLLVRSSHPVVVTGAMRNPTLAGPDGPANLLAAVKVAASPIARNVGTVIVMNDEIHAARFATKTHATSLAAFRSPNTGPIGWVSEDRVRIATRLGPLAPIGPFTTQDEPPIALVTCALGDDDRTLRTLASLGYRGVIVQGFGAGHVPSRIVLALEELNKEIPVVLTSRIGRGEVLTRTYGYPGSETDLLARGITSGGLLDGYKAKLLLSVALMIDPAPSAALELVSTVVASMTPAG